jgi:NAD(P)-dependent dehydrogenase (short-subunit alcohol dehydrogenase family)
MRILITGAASGFGRAVGEELHRRGEQVVGIDRLSGPRIVQADLRDGPGVASAVSQAIAELGGMDVLINNAGIGAPTLTAEPPDEEARATLDVNLFGAWRVTAAALPALKSSKGRVINVASALAFVNAPFTAAYCASKRGLVGYSDVLRLEHGDDICVTTVFPGFVATPIHQQSEELGVSLAGAVPEDSLQGVVNTIVRVIYARRPPREACTSARTKVGVFAGRHFPAVLDTLARGHVRRLTRRGHFSASKL